MASTWEASVTLIDADQKKANLLLKQGVIDGVDFPGEAAIALAALTAYVTDLKAVSDANVLSTRLTCLNQGGIDGTVPANESDVADELVLIVHTNDTTYPAELTALRIPAPSDSMFINDDPAQGGDRNDTAVQDYVDNFTTAESTYQVSDGEYVNIAEGVHGMDDAFWRSRARKID